MKWRLIIAAKVAMRQLNIPYSVWRRIGIFRHGGMDKAEYALKIFRLHLERAFADGSLKGKTVLELGPGDSLASAVIARAFGAERSYLVDAGSFATRNMAFYVSLAHHLLNAGLSPPSLEGVSTIEQLLDCCSAQYLNDGLGSMKTIGSGSVDFIWSHSVLEHILVKEVAPLMAEFRRILKPDGLMSHNIDFQDHLDHSLNNLRFSEACWESPLMSRAGFYTNRIRARKMHGLIEAAGFEALKEGFGRWASLPIPREKLDPEFSTLCQDDLLIRTSHILAQVSSSPTELEH